MGALSAHLRHGRDGIEYGLTAVAGVDAFSQFRDLVTGVWVPLVDRAQHDQPVDGQGRSLPVRDPAPVLDKLDFVARLRHQSPAAASS